MKRVGILGGTFDPIHLGHLLLARAAYNELSLDKVLIMPSNNPPHKRNNSISSNEDRLNMVKAAIRDIPYFEASDFEMQRDGITYTSDTLKLLNETYPDTRFFFIVGGDSIIHFESWHEPCTILKECALIAAGRDGYSKEEIQKQIEFLRDKYSGEGFTPEIYYLETPSFNISSHEIRNYVSFGMSVDGFMPEEVTEYIKDKGLYLNPFYEKVKMELKGLLKPARYAHVLSVAQTAVYMATAHLEDPVRAYTAGLLHDCAKFMNDEDMLKAAKDHNIELDDIEKRAVQLVHSKVGSVLAKEKYGIEDEEILSAIWYHTTGHPNMTRLEKIIYIADTVEPLRVWGEDNSELDIIRSVALSDLDKCLFLVLKHTNDYLNRTHKDNISDLTLKTYNYYKDELEARKEGN